MNKINEIFVGFINKINRSQLVKGFIITLTGSGIAKVINYTSIFVITHILSQELFGQFSFVRNTLDLILGICALNFASLCTKYTTDAKCSKIGLHRLILLLLFSFSLSLTICISLWIIPESILTELFVNPVLVKIIRIFALAIPIFFLGPLLQGVLRGLLMFKEISYILTIESIIMFIGVVAGSLIFGLKGAFFGLFLNYATCTILSVVLLLKRINIGSIIKKIKGFAEQYKTIYKVILPMFVLSFVEAPIFWLAQLLLAKNGGFDSNASMTVIMQTRNLIMIIPGYFFSTFIAFASKLYTEKNLEDYYLKYHQIQRYINFGSVISLLILIVFGKYILLVFGSEYVSSYPQYIWGIIMLPPLITTFLLRQHFIIVEKQRLLLLISLLWNIIWIILLIIFLNILRVESLSSFFITQDIAVFIQIILLTIFFQKDKKTYETSLK